jgi:hypothetical protein
MRLATAQPANQLQTLATSSWSGPGPTSRNRKPAAPCQHVAGNECTSASMGTTATQLRSDDGQPNYMMIHRLGPPGKVTQEQLHTAWRPRPSSAPAQGVVCGALCTPAQRTNLRAWVNSSRRILHGTPLACRPKHPCLSTFSGHQPLWSTSVPCVPALLPRPREKAVDQSRPARIISPGMSMPTFGIVHHGGSGNPDTPPRQSERTDQRLIHSRIGPRDPSSHDWVERASPGGKSTPPPSQ